MLISSAIRLRCAAAVSAIVVCLLAVSAAKAQEIQPVNPDQPVALIADELQYDSQTGTVTAAGNVEVYYGQRTLTADRIVYNDETGRIQATGDLVLRDPTGTTVFADAADLDADLRDGLVQGARSFLDQNTRMAAVEARRVDDRYNTLAKAVYSPCEVCSDNPTPLWRIRARRVIHDEQEKVIHYENAWFDVFGVPIGWLPYFQHPDPSVKRASGLLFPQFLRSSIFGFGIKQPYFFVIDESSDATLTPFFMTDAGLILEGEYRRAFDSGSLEAYGSITQNDYDGEDRLRGHLDTEGNFVFGDRIKWGWDITFASDDGYLRRFEYDYPDRLNSELFVERYGANGYFDVAGVYFQSLRDNERAGDIPVGLPVLDARYDFDDKLFGGDVSLFASGHVLQRNVGRDASRLSVGLDWERQALLSNGIALTGFAEVRGDVFTSFDDASIGNDVAARLGGHVGFEARYPWILTQESGASHIIEPVMQVIAAPYGGNGNNIPVEDSLLTEFDETNVIDRNHFSGLDNFEDGPRLNLLVRYDALLSENVSFDASVGRVFRLEDSSAFSSGSGLANAESDFVAAWNVEWTPYVNMRHRMRLADDGQITRNEFTGALDLDPFRLSARYVFFESDASIGAPLDREEITASAGYDISENWGISTFAQRDLVEGDFVRAGGTLTFKNECCEVDLFVTRNFNSSTDAPASTTGGVRVKLLTLGTSDQR